MTSEEHQLREPSELRIVLVGKVGVGKTSVVQTLLKISEEREEPVCQTECQRVLLQNTEECQSERVKIGGQTVVIVDTPGLCSAEKQDEEVMKEIEKGISLAAPGPHAFLLVLSCLDRFTEEERDMVEIIKKTFGENVTRHMMVLFTHGDQLKREGRTIQEFIEGDLEVFVQSCPGGRCVIDNRDEDPTPVSELLQQINTLVQKNKGQCYSSEVLLKAEGKDGRSSGRLKEIALAVNGSALAGAGLGAAVSHFVGSPLGVFVGAAAGGVVGGTLGGAGMLAAAHVKRRCSIQ